VAARRLISVVFHWFRTPPGRLGQICSVWPPTLPGRIEWDGNDPEFWLGQEDWLDRAGVDAELLQTTSWFRECFDAHLSVVRRPVGLLVGPPAVEPGGVPESPEALGRLIEDYLSSIPRAGKEFLLVGGRVMVHLWVFSMTPEQRVFDYLQRLRAACAYPLYLSVHPSWTHQGREGWDEKLVIFSGRNYLSTGRPIDPLDGVTVSIRPGFWSTRKAEPFLPRQGGRPYRRAWRELAALGPDGPDKAVVVWNEKEEGSQLHPSVPVRHTAAEPPVTEHSWEHCAVLGLPSFVQSQDDRWGRGRRLYVRATRRGAARWKSQAAA